MAPEGRGCHLRASCSAFLRFQGLSSGSQSRGATSLPRVLRCPEWHDIIGALARSRNPGQPAIKNAGCRNQRLYWAGV